MPRSIVAVAAPADPDMAVFQQERQPLVLLFRIEGHRRAVAIGGGAGYRCLNLHGAAELLAARADIECMQILQELAVELGLGNHVQGPGGDVYHRRAGDSHLIGDVAAPQVRAAVDGAAAGGNQALLPIDRAQVRIDGKHAVVLRGDVNHIVRATADADVGQVERLGIRRPVQGDGEQLAELTAVHVGRSQRGLEGVLSGAGIVVVVRRDIDLCGRRSGVQR